MSNLIMFHILVYCSRHFKIGGHFVFWNNEKIAFTINIPTIDTCVIYFAHMKAREACRQHTLYNLAKIRRHFEIFRHFDKATHLKCFYTENVLPIHILSWTYDWKFARFYGTDQPHGPWTINSMWYGRYVNFFKLFSPHTMTTIDIRSLTDVERLRKRSGIGIRLVVKIHSTSYMSQNNI